MKLDEKFGGDQGVITKYKTGWKLLWKQMRLLRVDKTKEGNLTLIKPKDLLVKKTFERPKNSWNMLNNDKKMTKIVIRRDFLRKN